ncbi:MAG: hypothetical protein B6D72_10515 [gamma proteobacterium symbiont of Ctena orbiculata]|uniref:Rap1a immunity protein domain-containing protein n=1 Tax=Candidatus Thiodiazotropha taylori TaxID=2792791 RepID=A0A944QUL0_9GAMM|nr:hypothetical protein [Candidatus Thiodiazotropha taylori]PUB81458.1 MAG: hypothetical protein DBP00_18950 [gamma proteobacterium symbiont of Ctena orbiculata]MBT2991203.1 hypothetical protein [Candidatus Thiodiazotropha taylori]MBT2996503.1 hypothetical protein [Candidatus Thiodiazotropha taylori]MBT3000543.1 hypothetical protein [Candidatus Thiodiazotropha taylori]
MKMPKLSLTIISVAFACCPIAWAEEECDKASSNSDYPTSARVDYVIGCMASNGQTHEMMQKCSCSIDLIAKAIPYDEYVHISTLLSLQQMTAAGRNAVYKSSTWSQKAIAKLRDVQADSTLRCF